MLASSQVINRKQTLLLILAIYLFSHPAVMGQQPNPQQSANSQISSRPLPSAQRIGVDVAEQTPITLSDAIRLALENNKDINVARINVQISQFDLTAVKGIFDPKFFYESFYERRINPVSSQLSGGSSKVTQREATGTTRFSGFAPWGGGSYQVDFSSTRLTTDNQFTSLSPQFPAALTITYTQPLLRGLRIDDNRRRIEIAKKNLSLTDAQFRERVIDIITRVERAYWDLVLALRNLQVQTEAVNTARKQVESNRRLVAEGILAPIEIVEAEAQVVMFEQNVYIAQEAITRTENSLKTLMLPDRTAPMWSQALLPVSPVNVAPPTISLTEAVSAAINNRPEIDQLQMNAEINEINTKFFRDQAKPQLDLFGIYNAAGLAGTPAQRGANPFTASNALLLQRVNELSSRAGLPTLPPPATGVFPEFLVGGLGQSLSNLFEQNFTTLRIGIRLSLPIRNRTAQANLGRSLAEGSRIQNQREQLELTVETEVRNSLQAIESAQARLAAAMAASAAAQQIYESEQRKFQTGLSTVFLVLQRQSDLVTARGREVQAQTDLSKAIADFYQTIGSTLKIHNITMQTQPHN
ncbi:MAG: TolC family protein [Acidobacteriota bacterium]